MSLGITSKSQAWRDILHASGIDDYDYARADHAYDLWQHHQGPKPKPWCGGELDAVNVSLDAKVSGPMEAFFVASRHAADWPELLSALRLVRQIPGMECLRFPSEVIEEMTSEIQKWHGVEMALFGAT